MNQEPKFRISKGFNVILFVFVSFTIFVDDLFKPEIKEKAPWDIVYEMFPVASIVMAIVLVLILIFSGAKLFQLFWNNFISDVFQLRAITFQEAIAIILISGVIFM